jgi:hypothetical protein
MQDHRHQATIEATKQRIEHKLHQFATASGMQLEALAAIMASLRHTLEL